MRLKTIFIVVIAVLLTIVIMQNDDGVNLKVLFFSIRTSKLVVMLAIALLGAIAGYLIGRPKRKSFNKTYNHGYDENIPDAERSQLGAKPSTLSDEDREYISGD